MTRGHLPPGGGLRLGPGAEGGGPRYTEVLRRLGKDGWLGLGWPEEYGGRNRPAIEQFLFSDEVQRAGFPLPLLTLSTVGPAIIAHGSDAQKARISSAAQRRPPLGGWAAEPGCRGLGLAPSSSSGEEGGGKKGLGGDGAAPSLPDS